MNNLVIGNTSQISHYFPIEYEKISSRNIDFNFFKDKFYDRIFICFAEQRTYIQDNKDLFMDINVKYTLEIIDFFSKICNFLIVYSTTELWNNCEGSINLNTPYNYKYSDYVLSKQIMVEEIKKRNYNNVIILYPFYFNSPYRKGEFLFAKIFNSVINETKVQIGNTYFYRDIIHPRYMVEKSISVTQDEIVGSGRLTFVNDFIREIYSMFHMNYNNYVIENFGISTNYSKNIRYLDSKKCLYSYDRLFIETFYDLRSIKLKKYYKEKYGNTTSS